MKVYFHEALVVLHHDRTEASAAAWLGFVLRAVALLARVHHAGASSRLDRSGVRVAVQRIESAITHMRPLRACVTGAEKELAKLDQRSRVMGQRSERRSASSHSWSQPEATARGVEGVRPEGGPSTPLSRPSGHARRRCLGDVPAVRA